MAPRKGPSGRRDVLKGIAAGGMTLLAGCGASEDDQSNGGDDSSSSGDGSSDGSEGTGSGSDGDGSGSDGDSGQTEEVESQTEEVESRTIQTGILMGVSGPLAESGAFIRDSAQACAQYIDETSDTFTIESQFADTALDSNQAISEANSMINQGAPMILGAIASSVTLQVANNVAIPNDIVVCSPASTTPRLTDLEDNDTVYRTALSDGIQGNVIAEVGRNQLDGQTAAVMGQNDAYGQGLGETFASAWEQRGGTVEETVFFEAEQSSYSSQLSTALASQPDVLMVVTFSASAVQLFRDYYSDFSEDFTDVLVTSGLREGKLPEDVGQPMNNVWGVAPISQGPSFDTLQQEFEERVGEGVNQAFVPQSWDAMAILALANAAAGENNGSAIKEEMRNVANSPGTEITADNLAEGLEMAARGEEINYQGASGEITLDENGDVAEGMFELWRFQGGNIEAVEEVDFSSN